MRSEVRVLLDPPTADRNDRLSARKRLPAIACGTRSWSWLRSWCLACLNIVSILSDHRAHPWMRWIVRQDELSDIVERFTSVSPVTPSRGLPRGLRPRKWRYCQVKYTNRHAATNQRGMGVVCFRIRKCSDALSGSDQARKGRLVDALAARGDEGRDTLR